MKSHSFLLRGGLGLSLFSVVLSSSEYSQVQNSIGSTVTPQVQLDSGLVFGLNMPQFGQDYFLGIPFAEPPLGDLRFSAPVPLPVNSSRVIDATKFGKFCMQPQAVPYFPADIMSEDCLTINVFRPAGILPQAKLPVLVWIYGGAFLEGNSSIYNGTGIVLQSVLMKEPVIFVSMNYRVNSLGFLASREMEAAAKAGEATLNAGLYDIRLALMWVQKNIGKFGGDKDKVTAFGESAGAMSIGSMLVADGGTAVGKLNLFRAAIMESGAPSGAPVTPSSLHQIHYDEFVAAAGCSGAAQSGTSLACLRALSSEAIYNASVMVIITNPIGYPFNRVIDGYFHDVSPGTAVLNGDIFTVPVITGNNLDEGTVFMATTINTTSQLEYYLRTSLYNANDPSPIIAWLMDQSLTFYPDDPVLGSPYDPVGASKTDRFFGPTNQYKRGASWLGDSTFQSGRRAMLNAYMAKDIDYPAYAYLFTQHTNGSSPQSGVFHGSEVPYVYGVYAQLPQSDPMAAASRFMITAWIAFANNLDPNRPYLPRWPKYGADRNMVQIGGGNVSVMKDDYRCAGIEFLASEAFTTVMNI